MNYLKSVMFICLFLVIYILLSYLFLPKVNLNQYGIYNTSMYEILGEKERTIDTVVIGDSLVYSSISPMDIYREYGYTVFDCAEPAQILPDTYNHLKIAIDSQKPKIVIIESNVLFRDASRRPWYNKPLKILKNSLPLVTYHNNWKKMIPFNNKLDGWTNMSKGYKKNTSVQPSENFKYMIETNEKGIIPQANYEYIEKIINITNQNNIKLIFIGLPSQKAWNYKKHNKMLELSQKYNLTYLNLNIDVDLDIDWETDTKDNGDHLNYVGAQKVSKFLGKYLKNLEMLQDHREETAYKNWNEAYKYFSKA